MLLIYKIFSFLLIPVSLLFGLMGIIIFFMAISTNPAFLLMAFALICYTIYCITSLQFLIKVVMQKNTVRSSLKDWIKVNAYGTAFISVMFIVSAFQSFSTSDITLRQQLSSMLEAQPELGKQISIDILFNMFKGVSAFLLVIGLISLSHVFMSFKLIRQFSARFV
ncbi:MAG: hypothetical protein K2X37_02840 [Chitinophagaceae bacterium]|nr:hypothetical protein [Chitinophagaceae bacterium]